MKKHKKRIIALLVTLVLIFAMLPFGAISAAAIDDPSGGDPAFWIGWMFKHYYCGWDWDTYVDWWNSWHGNNEEPGGGGDSPLYCPSVYLAYDLNGVDLEELPKEVVYHLLMKYSKGISVKIVPINFFGQVTKAGYEFDGWNTEPDGSGTSYEPGTWLKLNNSLKLYAVWVLAEAA